MAFKIVYRRDPVKVLRRVQPAKAGDITGAVERIAADPSAPKDRKSTRLNSSHRL